MNRKLHLALLVILLIAAGLSVFAYKALVLQFPLVPDSTSVLWTVEASILFQAQEKPAKLSLFVPRSSPEVGVVDESFISSGFGLTTKQTRLNRSAVWSIRRITGQQRLFYRALIRQLEPGTKEGPAPAPPERKPAYQGAHLAAAQSLIAELRAHSADVETLVNSLLQKIDEPRPEENVRLLLGKKADRFRKMVEAAHILHTAGISARAVHGVRLEEQLKDAALAHWLEVYDPAAGTWISFGHETEEGDSPYLIWWRGENPLARLEGGEHLRVKISVSRTQEEAIDSAIARAGLMSRYLYDYSLLSLPISTQAVFRLIVLVPIGGLIVVVLRNVIGLKTFGTFMPVLIALAFRETELLSGIAFFCALVTAGLTMRFYLEQLKLLLVPRLAAILVVVVMLMGALSVVTHRLGIERGLSVSLFPMVILTMTIERMSITWEEMGPFAALTEAWGSLLSAAAVYLVITNRHVEHAAFVFPELLLIVLAVILLLGRYKGYRMLELLRFRAITEP